MWTLPGLRLTPKCAMSDPDKGSLLRAYLTREGFTGLPEGPGERAVKCVFHGDRHASASVNFGKGVYHCHTCAIGGDVYSLLAAREHLDFRAAVEWCEQNLDGAAASRQQRDGGFLPMRRDRKHGGRGLPAWKKER